MIGLLITLLVAALAYVLLVAITGSAIVGIVAAILILIAGIPSGGFGFGSRYGGGATRVTGRAGGRTRTDGLPLTKSAALPTELLRRCRASLGLGRADGHLQVPVSIG